jgi:hypothetical protein
MIKLNLALNKFIDSKVSKSKNRDKSVWYSAIIKMLISKITSYPDKNKQLILYYTIKNLEKERKALPMVK